MSHEKIDCLIRCFHVDYSRPPSSDDTFEYHWRCIAIFRCDRASDPPDPPYCPHHRDLYHKGPRVHGIPPEVQVAVDAFLLRHTMSAQVPTST